MERSKMMMAMKRIVQLVTEVETENVQNAMAEENMNVQNAMAEDHGTVMSVVMDMLIVQTVNKKPLLLKRISLY